MSHDLPSPELLRKILRYEPETGKLFWRERSPDLFVDGKYTAARSCNIWNARYAEKEAFITFDGHGYKMGKIYSRSYLAHRVIFTMVYGYCPEHDVDHKTHR